MRSVEQEITGPCKEAIINRFCIIAEQHPQLKRTATNDEIPYSDWRHVYPHGHRHCWRPEYWLEQRKYCASVTSFLWRETGARWWVLTTPLAVRRSNRTEIDERKRETQKQTDTSRWRQTGWHVEISQRLLRRDCSIGTAIHNHTN